MIFIFHIHMCNIYIFFFLSITYSFYILLKKQQNGTILFKKEISVHKTSHYKLFTYYEQNLLRICPLIGRNCVFRSYTIRSIAHAQKTGISSYV